ncbi:MAG: hypothetical protein ATN35_00785 [Epulopiscium sp. Nele67-Bin004]|nr:MAG: hypothetical protein ATN35_00785 [Epulopiscium sp. Nele67-Bin004]
MFIQRKIIITDMLNEQQTVKVIDLANILNVSVDTIRRDLKQLEQDGILTCVHGGAVANMTTAEQFTKFSGRAIENQDKKLEATKKAISEIKENDVVFLNGGTTNVIVAQQIIENCSNITIITNNASVSQVFFETTNVKNIELIVIGGKLDMEERYLYGSDCLSVLETYFPDVAIFSINALHSDIGYTDFREGEIPIMQLLQKNARKTIAIMDSSKLQKKSRKLIFGFDKIDKLYMDDNISEVMRKKYLNAGVEIL